MYRIPLFALNFDDEERIAASEVIESRWISSGPKCAELEKVFAEMLGAKYAIAVASCTAALHLAVLTAGIEPGDEVIVPSLTFVATNNAVRYAGGVPVFCDIEGPDRIVMDPEKIESLITKKTKAIIVMHYAGFPCEMDRIMSIANRYNLQVIEDACHGPLSEYKGQKVGTIGQTGCFSFFSNKNISTGEGGVLVTNDESVYEKAKLLRSHGMTTMSYDRAKGHSTSYDVVELGYNYRLDDIRAAIGLAQLKKLEKDIGKRNIVREKYINLLKEVDGIIIPFADWTEVSASYIFPIVLKNGSESKRDKLREFLRENGIQTSVHYPPSHRFKIYQDYVMGELPMTDYVADNEITLPMYGSLTENQIEYIVDTLKKGLAYFESI